jgi:membrane-bound serine protease (ClpP class)
MDNYSFYAILLLGLGLALLVAELFIPSGGMIFVMALISLIVSVWCAWQAWGTTGRYVWFWSYLGSVMVLVSGVAVGILYFFPRTTFGQQLLAAPQDKDELTPYADEVAHLQQMVGEQGRTLTLLNPGGLVLVDGERIHCESEGMMIEPGQSVTIVGVKGNRVIVRASVVAAAESMSGGDTRPAPSDEPPLDFDVVQS